MTREMAVQNRVEQVNMAAVADLVKNNRRIASRMIAESLNIPKNVVHRILIQYFCSRDFFCCTLMRPPTKLQVFANF
jgi:hypothetical protein